MTDEFPRTTDEIPATTDEILATDDISLTDEAGDVDLDALLDELYLGQERITQWEIHRRAIAADLPADLLTRITAMPEGEYAVDEAAEVLNRPAG